MARKLRLSACVLTQNNEATIGVIIDQLLTVADEVILIDGGSSDQTLEIADTKPGVRVVNRAFDGNFARQRNQVFEHALGRWILMVDSDELLAPRTLSWIPWLIRIPLFSWFNFSRRWLVENDGRLCFLCDKPYYPDRQRRLFRNNPRRFRYDENRPIHEKFASGYRGLGWHIKSLDLLHYDLVLRSRESREQKAAYYQKIDPKFSNANHYYLWEERGARIEVLPADYWDIRKPDSCPWIRQ